MTTFARSIVRGGTMLTLVLGCMGQQPPGDVPTGSDVGETAAAIDSTRPVSVRFVNVAASSCSALTISGVGTALQLVNNVFKDTGLTFRVYSYESFPLTRTTKTRDDKNSVLTWDEISEVWQGLGISCPSCFNQGEQQLYEWLFQISKAFFPRQYVVWSGCGGGVVGGDYYPSAFIGGAGDAAHEFGHSFGLPHSFEPFKDLPGKTHDDCRFWDLVYGARGSGISNLYFSSRQDCINKTIGAPMLPGTHPPPVVLTKIDPRDADNDPENNGQPRIQSNSIITVHNPRCSGCTTTFGVPSPGVEEYSTGAPQIAGLAHVNSSGAGAVNTMTYCSQGGCPPNFRFDAEFLSASQVAVVNQQVAAYPWTQSDQTCSTGINGGSVCCPASCGSCGGPNCQNRPGGAAACCAGTIINAGLSCSQTGPPCIISDPHCVTGIDGGTVCCAPGCGTCGGAGCQNRPGGSAACCAGPITTAARSCSTNMPPCVKP